MTERIIIYLAGMVHGFIGAILLGGWLQRRFKRKDK